MGSSGLACPVPGWMGADGLMCPVVGRLAGGERLPGEGLSLQHVVLSSYTSAIGPAYKQLLKPLLIVHWPEQVTWLRLGQGRGR